jgi:DNA-binding HxlR family transcriptional regulator
MVFAYSKRYVVQGKKTFKEFSISPERIAPGILSSRLKWLEENELITKQKLPANKKENIYLLTEKGIELAPIITEIILWSDKNLRDQNAEMFSIAEAGFNKDKSKVTEGIQMFITQNIKSGSKRAIASIFCFHWLLLFFSYKDSKLYFFTCIMKLILNITCKLKVFMYFCLRNTSNKNL